jgi:acetyltransferase
MKKELYNIFNPGSIAVIGASNDKKSVGYSVFYNLLNSRGIKNVYPVNIKRKKILQNKCYKSILEIQEKLDLAVIATPSSTALELLDECGKKKVLGVVILSSGFLEDKKNGVYYSDQLLKKAKKYNFRIIGPNCLGFINNNIDLNCTFAKTKPLKGNIAIISQSGAIASSIIDISKQKKIGFNFFVSVGSLIDISYDEIIDYLYDDLNTKSLIIYMESVKNPKKFLDSAKLFSLKKPLLVFKSGKGELGTIAALSHTGNLAGDDVVFNSAIKKTGIIRIESIQELFNSMIFLTKNKIPFGNRIAIITNAGGLGVVSCDYLENSNLNLAKLSPRTIDLLKKALPEKCSFENPIDLLGDSDSNRYNHAINLCLNDNNVDSILVLLTPQSMTDPLSVAKVVI